jgi:hypothetical protein
MTASLPVFESQSEARSQAGANARGKERSGEFGLDISCVREKLGEGRGRVFARKSGANSTAQRF